MSNPISSPTLEQIVLQKIADELLAQNLIHSSQVADLISGKLLSAEDWRLLAEKALMLQDGEKP